MTIIDWNLGKIYHLTGGPCTSKRLPFRLVAGVWTLAAFIFVQAYTSTLFTYFVTPIKKSLINSIDDIAENSDINLFLKKDGTLDKLFAASSNRNNNVHWPSQQINFISNNLRTKTTRVYSWNYVKDSILTRILDAFSFSIASDSLHQDHVTFSWM